MSERTLVLIKPDAVERGLAGRILDRFEQRGLTIVGAKLLVVHDELAEEHYAEHRQKPFFGELAEFITSSPTLALVLEGESADRGRPHDDGRDEPRQRCSWNDPRRLRAGDAEQPRPRLGLPGVGGEGDRALVHG